MRHIVYFIFTISLFFYACNNADRNETTITDSTGITNDTGLKVRPDTSVSLMRNHAEAAITATKMDTAVTGKVLFDTASGGKVKMNLEITVTAMAGKSVAVHIHEHGDCGNGGESAHAHWNPTNEQHGKWGSSSYHSGDIGNVKLDKRGIGTLTLTSDRWTLGGSVEKNIIGKAIIVHSGMDDYKSQPSGNSGSRIGCGVIQ